MTISIITGTETKISRKKNLLDRWFSSNYFQRIYRKRFIRSTPSRKTVHGHWLIVGAKKRKLVGNL